MEDLDLFNIKLHPLLSKPKGIEQNWSWLEIVWDYQITTPWAMMFTFGESFDSGLYYSFVSSPWSNSGKIGMQFSIAERTKIE
ncbi:hypothetical protein [Spiroplasma endosymbiont of Phyllotreta cruciferae]|uniref:hypothetical protein n=1 Tax=Spiroplasma endosymbiont of Phyllotreta cruciferae TaxID=2886375 RepID=UPI0020A0E883|nr:hypothetical protein [Spiroplasma endosymbiont of Phyllotreta cruciferae]